MTSTIQKHSASPASGRGGRQRCLRDWVETPTLRRQKGVQASLINHCGPRCGPPRACALDKSNMDSTTDRKAVQNSRKAMNDAVRRLHVTTPTIIDRPRAFADA